MQSHFDVERAQERDSSPVIFGSYAETRASRVEGPRDPAAAELGATGQLSGALRATVTPLPVQQVPSADATTTSSRTSSSGVSQQPAVARTAAQEEVTQEVVIAEVLGRDPSRNAEQSRVGARESLASSVQLKVGTSETAHVDQSVAKQGDGSVCDSRVANAWRAWLAALARDPEAALAAAQAYQQLDAGGRDEWLSALEQDLASLGVPAVAAYGPLLAVESDPQRVLKMRQGLARSREVAPPTVPRRALLGRLSNGIRIGVLVEPLYLGFVQVLACAYLPAQRFVWVRHDPIAVDGQALNAGHELEGAKLELVPTRLLVDELARTVVSHRRLGGTLPDALCLFANLFGLDHMVGIADEHGLR